PRLLVVRLETVRFAVLSLRAFPAQPNADRQRECGCAECTHAGRVGVAHVPGELAEEHRLRRMEHGERGTRCLRVGDGREKFANHGYLLNAGRSRRKASWLPRP